MSADYAELEARARRIGDSEGYIAPDAIWHDLADAIADLRKRNEVMEKRNATLHRNLEGERAHASALEAQLAEAQTEIAHIKAGKRPFSDSHSTAVITAQVKEIDALHARITEGWTKLAEVRAEVEKLDSYRKTLVDGLSFASEKIAAAERERDRLKAALEGERERCIEAVRGEEELPGPIPENVIEEFRKMSPEEACRTIVRATKRGIEDRMRRAALPPPSLDGEASQPADKFTASGNPAGKPQGD